MPKIRFKRGLKTNLPILDEGEPGFTTDTEEFYIGSQAGNIEFAKQSDVATNTTNIASNTARLDAYVNTDANAELVDARGTYSILGDRLNNFDSSLAENAKIYVNVKAPPNNLSPCVGDGVTDDSAAMNAIVSYVASNGGGQVYFPSGTYMGWIDLYQKHNVSLIGAGMGATTLRLNVDNKNVVGTLQDSANWPTNYTNNISIERMTLDGNYNNIPANTLASGGVSDDNYQFGFYLMKVCGCTLDRVRCTNIWFTNDLFWNNNNEPTTISQTTVKNCIFDHCGDKPVTITGASNIYYAHLEIDNDSRNITVENCLFIGSDANMTITKNLVNCNDSATGTNQRNVRFINCKFYNQLTGIYGYGSLVDWLIQGNEFYNVGEAVWLLGNQSVSNGDYPSDVEISSNKIINTSIATFTGNAAYRVQGIRANIHDNTLQASNCLYGFGILCEVPTDNSGTAQATDHKIHDNNIFAKGFTSSSGGAIAMFGDGSIENNVVDCTDNTQVGNGIYTDTPSLTSGSLYRVKNNQIRTFKINQSLYPVGPNASVEKRGNILAKGSVNSGIATLVNGVATVNNAGIQANDPVILSRFNTSASYGELFMDGWTSGVSFTFQSSSNTDNGQVWWEIVH